MRQMCVQSIAPSIQGKPIPSLYSASLNKHLFSARTSFDIGIFM